MRKHALTTQLHTDNYSAIVPSDAVGDLKSRLGMFANWLSVHNVSWTVPNLAAYRDYLLNERGLAPRSVRTHLASIRARYGDLTRDRDLLYSLTPPDMPFLERKAFVDELTERIENELHPKTAQVDVTTVQDETDLLHLRLNSTQVNDLLHQPDIATLFGRRDLAMLALVLCTGIREAELVGLDVSDLEHELNGEKSIRVRFGKGNKQRLVPYGELDWVLPIVWAWLRDAGISEGAVFRRIFKDGKTVGKDRLTTRAIQKIFAQYSVWIMGRTVQIRPHDLRRTYARRLYDSDVDPVRIKQNLGHSSLDTTLGYIGAIDAKERRPPAMYATPTDILRRL